MQVGIGIGPGFGALGAARKTYARVVFIGASIVEQPFGRDLATPNATRTTAFRNAGLAVDVIGFGWSGYTIAPLIPKVTEALAAYPADTLFVIEIGGNNVSNTRPWATASTAQRNQITTDWANLIAACTPRKADIVICSETFRTYEDETDIAALANPRDAVFADEALGSKPYSDAIFIPGIAAWRPETINVDGNPVVDLYNATRNIYETYVSGDGVHPANPVGRDQLVQIYIDRLAHFINATPMPAPIVPRSVTPVAPVNTGAPAITGTAQEGQVLTASTGVWTGTAPITYATQWRRGGVAISGAVGATYTLVVADVGAAITVSVTATNAAGSASATSAATATVAAAGSAPANTVLPAITGTAQEGQTLSASTGTWTGTPAPTFTYQWRRNGVDIPGATAATDLLDAADVGATISVRVTATNTSGSASATSAATATVAAAGAAPANTVLPAITGTAQQGQTLSASTGTWTGTPAPTYAYQWRRNGVDIPGATAATDLLDAADVGAVISVQVTATNTSGSASATSAATATVTAAGSGSPLIVKFGSADTDAAFNGSRVLATDVRSALNPSRPAILLKYADGTNSPFSLLVAHPGAAINNNTYNNNQNGGRATGVTAFDGTLFNDFIYSDSLFADMVSGPFTLTLSGLVANASYSLSFAGSRNNTGSRTTRITDGTVTLNYDANLSPPPAPVTGLFTASAAGVITLTVSNPAGTNLNTWAYVGGMRVVAV